MTDKKENKKENKKEKMYKITITTKSNMRIADKLKDIGLSISEGYECGGDETEKWNIGEIK